MTTLNVPYLISPAIQVNRWIRNGLIPDAQLQSGLANVGNQIARWRTKEVFRWHGAMGFDPSGVDALVTSGSTRDRWLFAFHSGPFAKEVAVRFLMCMQSTTDPNDDSARLRILTTGGSTVGDGVFHYGSGHGSPNLPSNYATGNASVAVSPDTDYTAIISDVNAARIVAATVYERSLDPDTTNGYITGNYAAQMPIYDTDRSEPMALARSMWTRGGAHLMNWSADVQASPATNNLLTYKNVIDGISTGSDSTTPGFTIDLTYCNRLSQATSGVPVVLKAYGTWGGTGTGGTLRFRNSSGVSHDLTGFTTSGNWVTATFSLPGTIDKYDLMTASTTGGTNFSLGAVSLYQLE